VSLATVMMGTYVLWYGYQRSMRKQDPGATEETLQAADVARYMAKEKGRNRLSFSANACGTRSHHRGVAEWLRL
jgi:hypothetical protein